ncbi:MAG: hypothetical protein QW331_02665 [Candidatus Woesearchaeota archaeon]
MAENGFWWGLAAVVVIIGFAVIYSINQSLKECSSNIDCKTNQYCGSDFKCHDFPVVEKEVVKEVVKCEQNYVAVATILAAGLIIAVYIYRYGLKTK